MDVNSSKTDLRNLVESVELMRLQETKESLLSKIRSIYRLNEQFIFYNGSDIYFYNTRGEYLKKINKAGDGPEEYSRITDLWLEGDTLAIYSRGKSSVNKYSLEGDFISSVKLPFRLGHINTYKKGYVADMNFSPMKDSLMYNFVVFDKNFEPISLHLPFDPPKVQVLPSLNSVIPYKDGILFFRTNSDTVYLNKGNEFLPLVHFDFGDHWFWKNKQGREQKDFMEISTSNAVWEVGMSIGADWIYAKAIIGYSHWEYFLINRSSGSVVRIEGMPEDPKESSDFVDLGWEDGELLFAVQPTYISKLIGLLSKEQVKFVKGTTQEKIESSENPVLMWVKFK